MEWNQTVSVPLTTVIVLAVVAGLVCLALGLAVIRRVLGPSRRGRHVLRGARRRWRWPY